MVFEVQVEEKGTTIFNFDHQFSTCTLINMNFDTFLLRVEILSDRVLLFLVSMLVNLLVLLNPGTLFVFFFYSVNLIGLR